MISTNQSNALLTGLVIIGSFILTVQVNAVDCNPDNCPPAGCEVTGNDCQPNGLDDDIDIVGGTSQDCNLNRIPDECGWVACSAQASMISRGACPRFARTCHAWAAKGQA